MRNEKNQGHYEQTSLSGAGNPRSQQDSHVRIPLRLHEEKYPEGLTLCYMDTDSLIYDIKTDDFYKDIADDVKDRFDMSGYNPNRPLRVGLNKKVIGLMKDELGGEIMTDLETLRPKMYTYKIGGIRI